ncbi:MAG: ATP-binding protein [Candidatus Omnitrophica bacterium]|nr:ATP-binding protein [Candidatus Omnitrophota bacterium]
MSKSIRNSIAVSGLIMIISVACVSSGIIYFIVSGSLKLSPAEQDLLKNNITFIILVIFAVSGLVWLGLTNALVKPFIKDVNRLSDSFKKMVEELQRTTVSRDELFKEVQERKQAQDDLREAYSKLKETQDQLIQSEKMSAVGRLASGVAHEVKNPLAIIMQSVDYLSDKVPAEYREALQMINDNIKRADNIVLTLLDFAKATELKMLPYNINSILESSLLLIRQGAKIDGVTVVKELSPDLPDILVDKNKIEQVFLNVFLNAIQAMPQGGKLFVRTYLTKFDIPGRENDASLGLADAAVAVEIEDTGVGIPPEYLQKVFDPFFTTKGPRGGAGLGLSVSNNIINMHGGVIDIKSEQGRGTKIILTLKIK